MERIDLLNHREKVYWTITDTILQVKGLDPRKQYEVLCKNLGIICNAHIAFLFSYDISTRNLDLLSAYSGKNEYSVLNNMGIIRVKTNADVFDSFKYRNIQHSSKNNILDLLQSEIIEISDIDTRQFEKLYKGYTITTFRENNAIIIGHVYMIKNERLRMMDLIGAYINMAGMIIQESNSVQKMLAKNKQLKNARNRLERQKTRLVLQAHELERVNSELKELNSTKDKFFSIIAHDLKNPFNHIMGFSQVILENYKNLPKEKFELYLKNIYNSSKNTFLLLQNLLQWARSQTGTIKFEPAVINMKNLVEETFQLVNDNADKKSVQLKNNLDDQITGFGDANMLSTILRNLLTNAVKFTPEKGSVTVSSSYLNDKIKIKVQDTGIGMSADETKKLFAIDKSFSKTGTSGETGTGLGLILCKEFIEKHKGEIWVESKPARGTTFYFTIPLLKENANYTV